jgi:2'-5' RNA ligase
LFVALVPPEAVLNELDRALAGARATLSPNDLRWTARAQWHLTLAFLGEVSADLLPAVHGACAVAVHGRGGGLLQLRGGGRFGNRVLWAGLAGDRALVVDLAARLAAAFRAAGVHCDDGPYRAHLTLARAARGAAPDLRAAVDALAGFAGTPWQPDAVRLMHSQPGAGPGGHARHVELGRWPLRTDP